MCLCEGRLQSETVCGSLAVRIFTRKDLITLDLTDGVTCRTAVACAFFNAQGTFCLPFDVSCKKESVHL